jgi:tetratricopeptide (TPR) repeat protein
VLENRDEIDDALRLINRWLMDGRPHDLAWAGVASMKSRLLRRKGKFDEAWRVAQDPARTWRADCLEEGALALIDLGRLQDALTMAGNALQRYEGDDQRALVARILWMLGQSDEASQLLTSPNKRLSNGAWGNTMPAAFVQAFKKTDGARADEALQKLAIPSVPTLNLIYFLEYLADHDRADLAAKMGERLRGRGPAGWATYVVYHATLKAVGKAPAREWLQAHATPTDLDVLGKQSLINRDFELIWDLPDHPDPTKNEILNLIRAATLLHEPEPNAERRARLIKFFTARPKSDFVVYGLFLLGEIDRTALFAHIKDLGNLCSAGWLLGLSSAHEGRMEEANSWLQLSMETGVDSPPRMWGSTILGSWAASRGTLAEAARKKVY